MKLAALVGAVLVVGHALALPALLERCQRDDLSVDVRGGPVAPTFTMTGELPAGVRARATFDIDGAPGPGLHRGRWSVRYRGGYQRSVGAAQLVGPFQDPAAPTCSARVVVGQRFLDDGAAGPGTIAAAVRAALTAELRGFEQFPVGRFRKVARLEVRWARFDEPGTELWTRLRGLVGGRRVPGYARVEVDLQFSRARVPVTVLLVPQLHDGELRFKLDARAELRFASKILDWAADVLDGDRFVTRLANDQIDGALLAALGPPPPLELPGGRTLRFTYCRDGAIDIASNGWAALPMALVIDGPGGIVATLPPRLGPAPRPPPSALSPITLDLDLDAINGVLYELWRTGFLDDQLAASGVHDRFNLDATVVELLTVRLSPLRLGLPPVAMARPDGRLALRGELVLNIGDRELVTPARAWAALDIGLGAATDRAAITADVGLAELAVSCEPRPHHLVPCYGDLVAALADRAAEINGVLSATFTQVFSDLVVGQRVGHPDAPLELAITGATATVIPAAPNATIRVEPAGALRPVTP